MFLVSPEFELYYTSSSTFILGHKCTMIKCRLLTPMISGKIETYARQTEINRMTKKIRKHVWFHIMLANLCNVPTPPHCSSIVKIGVNSESRDRQDLQYKTNLPEFCIYKLFFFNLFTMSMYWNIVLTNLCRVDSSTSTL